MIINLLKTIFSYLFPPSCIICLEQTKQVNICDVCTQKLPLTREFRKPWLFSLYRYRDEPVTRCIHHIKTFPDKSFTYRIIAEHSKIFTDWVRGMLATHSCNAIIFIPTPIHRSRFLERGYNQAEIITESCQKILEQTLPNIPISIEKSYVIKKQATEKQALITNKKDRLRNVVSIFTTRPRAKLPAQTLIIIIDDVTTTGGTIQEMYNQFPNHPVVAFTLAH